MSSKAGRAGAAGVDLSYLNDKKLEKGKKKLLTEDVKEWEGKSNKQKKEEQREAKEEGRRAMKARAAKATEKVSWKKRAGGACAILFLCGVGFFNFLSAVWSILGGTGVKVIDVKDTGRLKEVLFSGEPWLVYCVNNETQNQRLPKVLEEGASSLKSNIGLRVGVLNCWDQTESGRSVAQRFKMKTSPPLAFVVANGNKPRVMNMVGVSKPEDIEKKALPALKLDIHRIDSLKKWPKLCTSRRACVVIGHRQTAQRDTAVNLMRPLLDKYRRLSMVTLDTSFWQLKLGDGIMKTRVKEKAARADVICLSRNEGPDAKGNNSHSGIFLQALDSSAAGEFMQACDERKDLVKVGVPPRIMARPSKPKKVTVPPSTAPTPQPKKAPAPPTKTVKRESKVDYVGSRETLEREAQEEALFEAVEEEQEDETADDTDSEADADGSSEEESDGSEAEEGGNDEDEVEL